MKKVIFIALAFLCIQQMKAAVQNTAKKSGFKCILSLIEQKNGVGLTQEDELAKLQKEYENSCVVCGQAIEEKDECENLTISCVDEPRTYSCKLREKSLDLLQEECPEATFLFRVHKKCQFSIAKYFCLRNTCNVDVACKAFGVCCLAGGLVFVIATSCAYALA